MTRPLPSRRRQLCRFRTRSGSAGKAVLRWGIGSRSHLGLERRTAVYLPQSVPRTDKLAAQCRRAPEKNPRASFSIIIGHCTVEVYLRSLAMSKTHSETSEDFEYIETPPAPTPALPVRDCGVRTTSVSRRMHTNSASE